MANSKNLVKLLPKDIVKKVVEEKMNAVWAEKERVADDVYVAVLDVDVEWNDVGHHRERVDEIAYEIDEAVEESE